MKRFKCSPEGVLRPQAGVKTLQKDSGYISPERAADRSFTPLGLGLLTSFYRGSCVPSVASQRSWSGTPAWTIGTHHRLLFRPSALPAKVELFKFWVQRPIYQK